MPDLLVISEASRTLCLGLRQILELLRPNFCQHSSCEDDNDYEEDESFATDAFAQIQMLREEFEISLHSVETKMLAKIDIIPIKFGKLERKNNKAVNAMERNKAEEKQKAAAVSRVVTPPTKLRFGRPHPKP
jgi:hypothetical protein